MAVKAAIGVVSGTLGLNNNTRFLINNQMLGGIVTGSLDGKPSGSYGKGAYLHLPLLERAQATERERRTYLSASFEGASGSVIQALNAAMFVAQQGATVTFSEVNDALAGANATVNFNDQSITGVDALTIESMGGNWTNASRTIADLGTVSAATSITSNIFNGPLGTGAAGGSPAVVTTLSAGGNVDLGDAISDTITCIGQFDSDLIPSTDSARDLGTSSKQWAELHVDTGHIDALTVTGTSTLSTVDINAGAIDGTIIGANTAAAGTFEGITSTAAANSFGATSFGDAAITNVGSLECDSVIVADAANGLTVAFGGNTTTNKITLVDNLAEALTIEQGGNDYIHFATTNDQEKITFGKRSLTGAESARFGRTGSSNLEIAGVDAAGVNTYFRLAVSGGLFSVEEV
tara:strand:- start:1761 stop:2978 length:1218 start_codon:yes stop_codon:yes gene_type:complete